MEQFIVKHPNFNEYLQLLDQPITRYYYSDDDISVSEKTITHFWVEDIATASKFDTVSEAREKYTSPLCSTAVIVDGQIVDRFN